MRCQEISDDNIPYTAVFRDGTSFKQLLRNSKNSKKDKDVDRLQGFISIEGKSPANSTLFCSCGSDLYLMTVLCELDVDILKL